MASALRANSDEAGSIVEWNGIDLQQLIVRRNLRRRAGIMVSLRRRLRQPSTFASTGNART
jgi:hypothetical protein